MDLVSHLEESRRAPRSRLRARPCETDIHRSDDASGIGSEGEHAIREIDGLVDVVRYVNDGRGPALAGGVDLEEQVL